MDTQEVGRKLSDFLDNQCQVEPGELPALRPGLLTDVPPHNTPGEFSQILVAYEMEIWDLGTLRTIHSHAVPELSPAH